MSAGVFIFSEVSTRKSSTAKIEANRINAQQSTGPKSEEGKAKSSLNAVKTGLTGRTVLLNSEDAIAYQEHVNRFLARYEPATDEERSLTHQIADTEWRLLRIPTLEAGIYALGHHELAGKFEHADPAVAACMTEAQIFILYQRQLNNLSIQENRLRRHYEKSERKLADLQKERKQQAANELRQLAQLYLDSKEQKRPFKLEWFGFDFSMHDLLQEAARLITQEEGSKYPLLRAQDHLGYLEDEEYGVSPEGAEEHTHAA